MMKQQGPRLLLAAVAVLSVQGCGTTALSSRSTNPVIQDFGWSWLSKESVLSTTASRRLALMSHTKDSAGVNQIVICSEPPPDVGETFAKALAAQIEAKAPLAGKDAEVGIAIDSKTATAIAPLLVRTQGLQVLRDSAFTLCVDKMNGWIKSDAEYIRIKEARFEQAIKLIAAELPNVKDRLDSINVQGLAAPQLTQAASAPSLLPPRTAAPAVPGASAPSMATPK